MMKATLSDGREVRILFKHERFLGPVPHLRKYRQDLVFITGQTTCRVVMGPREAEVEVVAPGIARCSESDNFEKETARQKALYHALGINPTYGVHDHKHQKLVLPLADTGALLAAYFGRNTKAQKK